MYLREVGLLNHSRLNRQHNLGEEGGVLYDHLMSMKIFTSIMNIIFVRTSKIIRQVAAYTIRRWQASCVNCILHILGEVGAELTVSI